MIEDEREEIIIHMWCSIKLKRKCIWVSWKESLTVKKSCRLCSGIEHMTNAFLGRSLVIWANQEASRSQGEAKLFDNWKRNTLNATDVTLYEKKFLERILHLPNWFSTAICSLTYVLDLHFQGGMHLFWSESSVCYVNIRYKSIVFAIWLVNSLFEVV